MRRGAPNGGTLLDLSVVPIYPSDTPTLEHASNAAFGASVDLPHSWDLEGDVIPRKRDTELDAMAWAVAIDTRIRGHPFLLYLGDSQATATGLLVGCDLPGGLRAQGHPGWVRPPRPFPRVVGHSGRRPCVLGS